MPGDRHRRELNRQVWRNGTQVRAGTAPDNGVVHAGAADAQHEITGRHVHLFDGFVGAAFDHAPHARHLAHAGTEFQVAFLFNENTPRGVQAVYFPDRGVFHRMIIMNRKGLAGLKGQHQNRCASPDRRDCQFQPSWKLRGAGDDRHGQQYTGSGNAPKPTDSHPGLGTQLSRHGNVLFLQVLDGSRMQRNR